VTNGEEDIVALLRLSEPARSEMKQGMKLIEEALRELSDTRLRDQAEYCLANLLCVFAERTKDEKERERLLAKAISRFSEIVDTYTESQYVPKAQYKKALSYEKLGQTDNACKEYAKLIQLYPKHELSADATARIGQHHWNSGKEIKKLADELKQDGKLLEAEVEYKRMRQAYKASGMILSSLEEQFPNHKLAARTKLLSGQAFMQAQEYEKAIAVFERATDRFKDDKELMPEALYWYGHCYFLMGDTEKAYMKWKTLSWDYPESKWAKYRHGR
jgi:TolA-binding protein